VRASTTLTEKTVDGSFGRLGRFLFPLRGRGVGLAEGVGCGSGVAALVRDLHARMFGEHLCSRIRRGGFYTALVKGDVVLRATQVARVEDDAVVTLATQLLAVSVRFSERIKSRQLFGRDALRILES
jgi:hypothetical protein